MSLSLLKDLNEQQKQAVTYDKGPLLILAGAGSGKTRALTYRAGFLILEKNLAPQELVLVTFTNKAANEMKERIKKICGLRDVPYAGTFHSFCARILRIDGKFLGIEPTYLIYDTADQLEAVKIAMRDAQVSGSSFKPASILAAISSAKNELIGPLEYPQYSRGYWQQTAAKVYLAYQKILKKYGALDFDDLLMETVRLFQKHPPVLAKYQNRYRYLLVDEYQDTNQAQYELTKMLCKKHRQLTVVGDVAQSIYGWRGANFRNVLNLKNDFPELKILNLEQNYRSKQIILEAAHSVIVHNTTHPVLKLWTEKDRGEKIKIYEARSEKNEAQFVIDQTVKLMRGKQGLQYADFAVLYRTNAQSRVLEEAFLHHGIPYTLVGGTRFYERKEIKDCLAFLHLLANPKDMVSFIRLEKLGKKRLYNFLDWQETNKKKLANWSTVKILDAVLKATDYLSLFDPKNEQDLARLENIKELHSVAAEFPNLIDFLENVALVEQEHHLGLPANFIRGKQQKNSVTLMTAHAAKGLEFKIVFMVGMEEGLFPHSRSLMSRDELEEERRLAYVGMTRAKDYLYLTYAYRRLYFGIRSSNLVSRFVAEIPDNLLELINDYSSGLS